MIRRLFICLSVVFTLLCFITSCKKNSSVKDDAKSENVKHSTSKKHKGDLVIRDDKTIDEESKDNSLNEDSENSEEVSDEIEEQNPEQTDTRVYDVAEKVPEFPGGIAALNKYISDKTKTAAAAATVIKPVRTMVSCIIEADGSVSNASVAKSSGNKSLDNEAVKIVTDMPAWTAAQSNGNNIRMRYIVSVVFNPQNKK